MYNYSIVKANADHIEETCQDIIRQTKEGITDLALFSMTLVPEGDPPIDKAGILAENYKLCRDRLRQDGVDCGILVQATIGHNYPLDSMFGFQRYVSLADGTEQYTVCPYDEDFRAHMRGVFATLASLEPKMIMVDDDFRLMHRSTKGCVCPRHMAEVSRRAGREVTREEIYEACLGDKKDKTLRDIFVETQKDSLIGAAKAMREGIDSVDPTLPGSFCCVGPTTEFGSDIARIFAGKGNPVIIRINNGNYTPAGAKRFNEHMHRAAKQIAVVKKYGVDVILAETDTCPQNRYSTSAQNLHAHFTGTILEGASGAKHWITRLAAFEPRAGEAYRKKLAANKGFYETLSKLQKEIKWQGCATPVSSSAEEFNDNPALAKYGWSVCVLERLGLPHFFTSDPDTEGAVFLEDIDVKLRTDDQLIKYLSKTVVFSGEAARLCCERGLGEYLGVELKKWNGKKLSGEAIDINGGNCPAQVGAMEIHRLYDGVKTESTVYHVPDGKTRIPLFPGCTSYKNSLGGTAIVFCGDPCTNYHYTTAFSFLNESRKLQLIDLLGRTGNLPVYYPDDMEMLLRAGRLSDGSLFVAAFDISLDRADTLSLVVKDEVEKVEQLMPTGEFKEVVFTKEGNRIEVKTPVYTLEPIILKIRLK